ncbi:hypothetical protein ABW20_dc0100588 [Dactylellina cionopaga]|nr:hypothetical protein ABW20_dc0100588 [Dactylellina cionopaga]
MQFTRAPWIRNAFHVHPHRALRGYGVAAKGFMVKMTNERVPLTIWDEPKGIPFDNTYLVRLLDSITSSNGTIKPAVTERSDYDVGKNKSFPYMRLGTDMFYTRNMLVNKYKDVLESENIVRGCSVGLIADRSYEFVGGLSQFPFEAIANL